MIGSWGTSDVRCKIASGWEGAERQGRAISYFDRFCRQLWVVVKWDDEEDPDLHKASGLLIQYPDETFWTEV